MEDYKILRNQFQHISQKYWEQTGKMKICERCNSNEEIHLHHKQALSLGGTNEYENLVPLCNECHREFHRHFEVGKSFETFMNTPKHTELICIWEMLNSQTVDFLLGKEVKDVINRALQLKRETQKVLSEELLAEKRQLK
ncbi:HNH endonuclease [Bacillus anthracis]|nr:HNH endonuclease [Bacillus anthracis]